jgi:nitroreductase
MQAQPRPQALTELAALSPEACGYRPEAVPRELIAELLGLATQAPSNFNRQPWQFLVAANPEACALLNQVLRRRLEDLAAGTAAEAGTLGQTGRWDLLRDSPVWILAFYKPSPEHVEQVISATLGTGDVSLFNPNLVSLGMAVQNLLLAARDRGLFACCHFPAVPCLAGEVNRLFHLPVNLHLAAVVSLGHPASAPPRGVLPPPAPVVQFLDEARPALPPEEPPPAARPFAELARTRRSVRRYQQRALPRAVLHDLLQVARCAPSPLPVPPWRFLVADAPERCRKIAELLSERIGHVERMPLDRDTAFFVHPFLDHQRRWNHPLEEGQALVLCCYEPVRLLEHRLAAALGVGAPAAHDPLLLSLGMAVQNLLLAAHDRGVGACMQSGPVPFLQGSLNGLLDAPTTLRLAGVVSLGYPGEMPAPKQRKPVERVTRFL